MHGDKIHGGKSKTFLFDFFSIAIVHMEYRKVAIMIADSATSRN